MRHGTIGTQRLISDCPLLLYDIGVTALIFTLTRQTLGHGATSLLGTQNKERQWRAGKRHFLVVPFEHPGQNASLVGSGQEGGGDLSWWSKCGRPVGEDLGMRPG